MVIFMNKLFHIGDILSITTEILVSPTEMDGVYKILNYMTNNNLTTVALVFVSRDCKSYLLKQHPQLENVDVSNIVKKNWKDWLEEQVIKYGEMLSVKPLSERKYEDE